MLPELDNVSIFLGAVTLALLSIYTIEKCRHDSTEHLRREETFLFQGKSRAYCLAGNLGSVFSATYFFGATFIYGLIFRGTLLLVTVIIFVILFFFIPLIMRRALATSPPEGNPPNSNLLMDFLKAKAGPKNFNLIALLYLFIYFGLLVEEIAVSRLILWALFPFQPAIATAMLATICFVILTYVNYGGFRAILISDFEQLKVLVPFLALLVFLIFRDSPPGSSSLVLDFPYIMDVPGLLCAIIFGVSWFGAAVDFYSRLNFPISAIEDRSKIAQIFARISLACIFLMLVGDILFGGHLVAFLPQVESPSSYTQAAIKYFLGQPSRAVVVIFFLAIFCMLFTTINTLIVVLLQVGWYAPSTAVGRRNLTKIFLVAAVLSCIIPFDAVSAVGIYFGSLIIIPFSYLIQLILPSRAFPRSLLYLWIALAVSAIVFALSFERLELSFDKHFLIPGIVAASSILALFVVKGYELTKEAWDAKVGHG